MTIVERRYLATEFEVRAKPTGGHVVDGYAAKFNRLSQNLGGFVEQIAPGAFAKTIQEADVRALFNHDPNIVLGRNKAGTLRMSEDGTGLYYEVDMPDTTVARDLVESMRRGDISQSSFGFATVSDEWGFTEQDFPLRTLGEVKLYDVSPVTYPAYLDTDSQVARSALRHLAEVRSLDLDAVAAAATAGDLRSLILGEAPADEEERTEVPVTEEPAPDATPRMTPQKRQAFLEKHPFSPVARRIAGPLA